VSPAAATAGSPRPPRPLLKVRRPSESCVRPDHGAIGFPAPATASAFLTESSGLSPSAVHRARCAVSSSRELSASSREQRPALPFVRRKRCGTRTPESASLGVSFLIATSAGGVHHSAGSRLRGQVPSSTFLASSTVSSATSLAGLFHPAATSRICPSGACSSPRSRAGFRRPSHALLSLDASSFDRRPRPRLQGLAPRGECGVFRGLLDPGRSAPLLGFASPGFSLRAP
jgi:hypothetical protein